MYGIYKVVLNGSYYGKDNQCILWYRTAVDMFGGAFGFGGAIELADQLQLTVQDPWLNCKPQEYRLQTIDITPHNDLLDLVYQKPYKRVVDEPGAASWVANGTDGPAICANFNFNLEPVLLGGSRLYAPSHGYVAVGPIQSAAIDDAGQLVNTFGSTTSAEFGALGEALCANLVSIAPPAVFFPIRVTQKWGLVGDVLQLLGWGWADVNDGAWNKAVSFRRSRRIKG